MVCISTIEHQTRLDIQEVLSRYCYYLDHGQGDAWADLFTLDGIYESNTGRLFQGRNELREFPQQILENGNGLLRHVITSMLIDRCSSSRELVVLVYGMVADLDNPNCLSRFYDYRIHVRRAGSWRLSHVIATQIGRVNEGAAVGTAARNQRTQQQGEIVH